METTSLRFSDSIDDINWKELSDLYLVAPLGSKDPADLKISFSNSRFTRFVFDGDRLVGVGRVLADGVDCAYICDMAVHPSHQGTGLGKRILAYLLERAKGHRKIILYAVPGKEGFYQKLGFQRMTTAMAIFDDQEGALQSGLIKGD